MFCAVVLIMVMLPIQAFAADYEFLTEVKSNVKQLLGVAAMQRELYGFDDVDFSDLHLGTEISLYKVESDGLTNVADIHYFPIVLDGEWVATVTVTYNTLGEMSVELSKIYVDEYKTIDSDGKVALIFDGEETRLYVDDGCASTKLDGEIGILSSLNTVSIEGQTETLQVQSVSSSDVVSLGVPQIQQSGTKTCWAACMASIINYQGGNVTEKDILRIIKYNENVNEYESPANVHTAFENKFGKTCSSMYSILLMGTLTYNIGDLSSPICAYFGSSIGHMVVVQGYVNTSSISTMSYMDPKSGTYKVSTVPSSGKVSISWTDENGNTVSNEINTAFAVYDN